MCGIIGCIGHHSKPDVDKILKNLHHRGPDDNGYLQINDNSFIGHTRLSILDTTYHGHQPMTSSCGNFIIVYNGEIYNHAELRSELEVKGYNSNSNSDTEIVLNLYIETKDKESFLNKLKGMFAFCIYDIKNQSYFFARDRFGIKPLIYSYNESSFYFSSEVKPLVVNSLISGDIDNNALDDYLQYGSIVQPKTIYKHARHLMPSHYMIYDKNGLKIKRYYDLRDNIKNLNLSHKEAIEATRRKLEDAVKYHMVSDVDIGAFLSAGVDSTATVALMQKFTTKQVNTFSIGFETKQKEVVDELSISRKSAKILNTIHHEIKITDKYISDIFDTFIASMDQPSIDGLNTYIVSKETSKFFKVAISGLGGDEIFAGYPHFKTFDKYHEDKASYIKTILKNLNKIRPNRYTDRFNYSGLSIEQRVDRIRTLDKSVVNLKNNVKNSKFTKIQRVSFSEIDNYLLNTLLRDNDNFSMAHSLEVRPILLDHELVEFAVSLKDRYKINNGVLKSIFKDSVKDLIPEFVQNRQKSGFVMPIAGWMNGVLNEKIVKLVTSHENLHVNIAKEIESRAMNKRLISKDWKFVLLLFWLNNNTNLRL